MNLIPLQSLSRLRSTLAVIVVLSLASLGGWWLAKHGSWMLPIALVGCFLGLIALQYTKVLIFLAALTLMANQSSLRFLHRPLEYGRWLPPLLLSLLLIAGTSMTAKLPRRFYAFDGWMIAWISFAFISAFYSIEPTLTIGRASTLVFMYFAIFWACWSYANRAGEERVMSALLYAGWVVYVVSLALWPLPSISLYEERFRGLLENPNSLGLLTAVLFPLALGYALLKRYPRDFLLTGLMAVNLILTGSRGSMVATLVGAMYILWIARHPAFWGIIGVVGLLIASLLWLPPISGILADSPYFRTETLATGGGRIEAWLIGYSIIHDHLIWGHGFGTEELLFAQYGVVFETFQGGYFHNSYLGLTAQTGLVGALAFFLPLIYFAVQQFWKSWRHRQLGLTHVLQGTLFSGLVAGLFESWMYSMGNAQSFPFWVAVMLLIHRTLRDREGTS